MRPKYLKKITKVTIALAVIVVAAAVAYQHGLNAKFTAPSVNNGDTVEVKKEIIIEKELDKRVEEAQKAAQEVIRAEAQAAYDSTYKQAMNEVKLKVVGEYKVEVEKLETELSKEVDAYWREPKNVIRLIKGAFPEDPHTAVAVARCESGLKPTAHNSHNKDGSADGGLWQINTVHDKELQKLGLDKYSPRDATKYARMLYEERRWNDWVCFTHKKIAMR